MRRIIVLGGGSSVEREVSLRSSQEVEKALQQNGYKVDFIDPKYSRSYLEASSDDIIFPVLHGEFGEDGTVQQELEQRGIPYLGSDSQASKICFDKWLTRKELQKHNIPVAKGEYVDTVSYHTSPLSSIPHVLKAVSGGSSIGTAIIKELGKADIKSHLEDVFSLGSMAVIEEFVAGVEITVSIFDSRALPVIEIQPPANEEFDYTNKYNGKTKELCPPVSISTATQHKAQDLALKAHQILGCRHLSRVDIIVRPDGEMVILEVNTMPGMTNQSLYPKAALVAGMDFKELMKRFVEIVERDYSLTTPAA